MKDVPLMLSTHVAKAQVYLDRIVHNYAALMEIAGSAPLGACLPYSPVGTPWPGVLPVVKADAYGLGHVPVAAALCGIGVTAFGSGGVGEAVALREGLAWRGGTPGIIALLGFVSEEECGQAEQHQIIPLVHCFEQLEILDRAAPERLAVAVKFNSGMSRLGFMPEDAPRVVERLRAMPGVIPVAVLSHFACSEDPGKGELNRFQMERCAAAGTAMRRVWPEVVLSLCNSGGLMFFSEVSGVLGENMARSGLALYGVHPLGDGSAGGFGREGVLRPALEVSCPVLARRVLEPGTGLGYGHAYVARQRTEVAIIGIGYADGFTRGFSNRGMVNFAGRRLPVLGRVSMQMTAVDCTHAPDMAPGDTVHILGGPEENALTCNELADIWQTTPHEVLCMLGNNLHKEYQNG